MKIRIKKSNIGSLHTALGVPQDEKIPHSKLQIHESDSPSLKKKKQFALNAAKWKHEMGGLVKYRVGGPFEEEEFITGSDPNYGKPVDISNEINNLILPMGENKFTDSDRSLGLFGQPSFRSQNLNYTSPKNLTMATIGTPSGQTPPVPESTSNTSNWLKDNYGLVGQLGSAALSAGIQSGRINRLARPRTLSSVRLSDRVATPAYVDYSAERNAIDRATLNAMGDAQRGFGSSAAAQAFKNKARLNQLEGTGKSFQQQSNVNTQLKNQFQAAQQEAAMKEAMINNEIEKYNLENIYGYDTMTAQQKNAITAMLANTAGQTFGKQTDFKNQMEQAKILANARERSVNANTVIGSNYEKAYFDSLTSEQKLLHNRQRTDLGLPAMKYGGTIKKRSLKK